VTSIDLGDVTCLEIGCALLAGWLVIRVRGPVGPDTYTIPFSSHGIRHFRALVRVYRAQGLRRVPNPGPAREWREAWAGTPAWLRSDLEPLVEEAEPPLAILRSPERWTSQERLWSQPLCESSPGLLVATRRGLVWAASEPRMRPEGLAFGVNVTVVRSDHVSAAVIREKGGLCVLHLRTGEGPSGHDLEVPFERGKVAAAEAVAQLARRWNDGK
jgi:hypothetical protein